jgi:hypothetical protein
MLKGKKQKEKEKDEHVNNEIRRLSKQLQTIEENHGILQAKLDSLEATLNQDPSKALTASLGLVSEELRAEVMRAKKELEEIHQLRANANSTASEIRNLRDQLDGERKTKLRGEMVESLTASLSCLREDGTQEAFLLIVLHMFMLWGHGENGMWIKIVTQSKNAWHFDHENGATLHAGTARNPFLGTQHGRAEFIALLKEHKILAYHRKFFEEDALQLYRL